MGGSSGGSKNKGSGAGAGAKPTPMTYHQVQPFMPGFDNALAQQLAMGFGGAPNDFLKQFAQTYAPMQVPNSPVYMNPTPAPSGASGGGGGGQMSPEDVYKMGFGQPPKNWNNYNHGSPLLSMISNRYK